MGINISMYKIIGSENIEPEYGFGGGVFYTKEPIEWWDSLRYSGDKEFTGSGLLEGCYPEEQNQPPSIWSDYARPKDFNKCREWIKANVPDSNQSRLLRAMDEMEEDESLVFRISH